jgi:hypothetical protein
LGIKYHDVNARVQDMLNVTDSEVRRSNNNDDMKAIQGGNSCDEVLSLMYEHGSRRRWSGY